MRIRRPGTVIERVRSDLIAALLEEQSPHAVAASFALGTFITALPTLGTGLLVMAALAYLFTSVNRIAMLASVAVLNPLVKGGVYVASFGLGRYLLGPVPGVTVAAAEVSLTAGPDVAARLLVGNLLLAAVFTAAGYVLARRTVRGAKRRRGASTGRLAESPSD